MKKETIKSPALNSAIEQGQFFLYKDSAGNVQINTLMRDETFWLTQKTMAELFEVVSVK